MLRQIHITGVVQGVGFRPFVYQLATRAQLRGWVANTSSGVNIEVEGDQDVLDAFVCALENEKPPLARIDSIHAQDVASNGAARFEGFEIRASVSQPGAFQPISPDFATCPDCLRELFDPNDRRYLYPFINCTNCGPRFTIIRDIPYDRPLTTMRDFQMCAECAREYHDPRDRRFHAQPVACAVCGPKVWLEENSKFVIRNSQFGQPNCELRITNYEFILEARRLLAEGHILAIKGLGGFHLACDATNDDAVRTLRARKGRVDKPFALMARDVAAIENFCFVSDAERALLESRARPIVLLRRRPDANISESVAPQNNFLGVMLPYTPLHYLLLADDVIARSVFRDEAIPDLQVGDCFAKAARNDRILALVMTSGNFSEEPIATDNADARARLANLADYFLLHDRDIETRADDSVMRVFENRELPMRRSRGYAPYPVKLPFETRPTLAVGAELKSTFCVTREQYAFLSQHIGDLENFPTLESFQNQIEHFKKLFRIEPEIIAHDLHPEYLSTKYAKSRLPITNYRLLAVQHHHAHIAACMAENNLARDERVIGIALDGTGYGTDNKIWGGELLLTTYHSFERAAHLAYVALPGGDAGIKRVYRAALAQLHHAGIAWDDDLPCVAACPETECGVIRHQIETGFNAPLTSSMGRLFDAVAAIIGVRATINYEAQAAIELEHLVVEDLESAYEFEIPITSYQLPLTISPAPVIRAIVADYRKRVPPWVIATKFHNAVAVMLREVAVMLRARAGINRVALSGGVFQNVTLLGKTVALLRDAQFGVLTHRLVPPNDAGIALGQAAVANAISD